MTKNTDRHKPIEITQTWQFASNTKLCTVSWVIVAIISLSVSLRTELTPENPLWVGAWWIGFLAGGAASLVIALPILGYPRQLPGATHKPKLKVVKWLQYSTVLVWLTVSLSVSCRLSAVCGHAGLRGPPAEGWQSGHCIWSSVWQNGKGHAQVWTHDWRGRSVSSAVFSNILKKAILFVSCIMCCTTMFIIRHGK